VHKVGRMVAIAWLTTSRRSSTSTATHAKSTPRIAMKTTTESAASSWGTTASWAGRVSRTFWQRLTHIDVAARTATAQAATTRRC